MPLQIGMNAPEYLFKGLNQPYHKVPNLFKGVSNTEMFKKVKKFL